MIRRAQLVILALGAWLLVTPEGRGEPATAPASETKPAEAVDPGTARTQLEAGVAEIGKIAADVREQGDPRRLACVVDKRERADRVLERATDDLLVYQDTQSDAQTRTYAAGKLSASTERMTKLVELARRCKGLDAGGRAEDEDARTGSEPSQIPSPDPTRSTPTRPNVPPPFDPDYGPVSSAVR
ncbi:MAG: hypothetical protein R3A51_02875 [Nannocystaceae bacterium]|nr:hypothetical protein [Myxococcales bacterium]